MESTYNNLMNRLCESLSRIEDEDTSSLVKEAIKCYEHNLYRSAIVMSWMAAVYILYKHVCARHLDEFNKEARSKDKSWKNAETIDDLGRMKETVFLDRIEALSIISRSVKNQLKICLSQRNNCSHSNLLELTQTITNAHFETLLLNVFSESKFTVTTRNQKANTIELIQKEVSAFFNLTLKELKSTQKQRKVSEPRQIAMFLSRKYTSSSFPEIGEKFGGKNHSTVVHAVKNVEKKINQDSHISDAVSNLCVRIEKKIG